MDVYFVLDREMVLRDLYLWWQIPFCEQLFRQKFVQGELCTRWGLKPPWKPYILFCMGGGWAPLAPSPVYTPLQKKFKLKLFAQIHNLKKQRRRPLFFEMLRFFGELILKMKNNYFVICANLKRKICGISNKNRTQKNQIFKNTQYPKLLEYRT